MFPFVFAFILAIGIPFLPSSLHRALHFPSLTFNFLSASYAPEKTFVPSPERPLLLENGYSRDSSDSAESSQYLVFSDGSSPNYSDGEADSDVLAYMSFAEKLELNYPQTSIWLIICAQLLYKLVEATFFMTLSFLFAATFLSRRSLSTLVERFCTALFICWHYTPKAALSSFFQDILIYIHMYWMDSSVTSDQAPTAATNISLQVPLGVLADSTLSTALIASKEANCWSKNSSSVALITPPRSRETSAPTESALIPLGQPVYPLSTSRQGTQGNPIFFPTYEGSTNVCSHPLGTATELSQYERSSASDVLGTPVEHNRFRSKPSIITRDTNQNSNCTGANTSNSTADLSGTDVVAASLSNSSTPSFVTISMQDLYNANKPGSIPISLPAPPGEDRETAISGSSLDHGSITNINSTTSKPQPEESQAEGLHPSPSERSYSGRRRYKSDSIQVRSARCHLGDSAASPDPAKVDGTCAFWKSGAQHDECGGGVCDKQVLAPGFPSGTSSLERISRSKPDQAVAAGSVGLADAALTGIVLTPEGEVMVPASQRADGSMRKAIKVRSGHFLREPLAEKYRPPPTRIRTSTWDPRLREHLATPPSSPYARNSPLPFTPTNVHQRFFGRQYNSPASLSNNWRRSSWNLTVVETPLTKGNDPLTPPPPPVKKLPAPEFPTPSQTEAMVSPMSARALVLVNHRSSLAQPGDQLLSRPSELECVEKVTESSKLVRAATRVWDKEDSSASFNAKEESRLPLRDITTSLLVPAAVDRLNPPSTPTVLASTTAGTFAPLEATNVFQRDLEAPSRTPVMESRETLLPSPHRKRKPSGEPNTLGAVRSTTLSPSTSPTPAPHRRPRARRSAPHLGKSASNKRQVKAQTPEGSAKRRRMRTASALGVENVAVAVAAVARAVDRYGQIVLPAGTGWKGRSLTASLLPVAQRQKQPTLASGATP